MKKNILPNETGNKRSVERDRMTFFDVIRDFDIHELEIEFEKDSINSLNVAIQTTKLFLLGEIHGVKENVNIIYTIYKKFKFKKLALEWDQGLILEVNRFLQTGELNFEFIKESADGRITAGHFALLKKLRDEGLLEGVICLDSDSLMSNWNERDANMAKNIMTNLNASNMMVVAGNLHVRTAPITQSNRSEVHHPMGENIKKLIPNVPSCHIEYLEGQFYNFGVRTFKKTTEDGEFSKVRFYQSEEGVYTVSLPHAHVAVVPNPYKFLSVKK